MKKRKMFLGKLILTSMVCASMSMQALAVSGDELLESQTVVDSLEDSAEELLVVPADVDELVAQTKVDALEDSLATDNTENMIAIPVVATVENTMFADLLGDGSWANPYQITKKEHFKFMEEENEACFVLRNNIDLKNEPWTPIEDFRGEFYANGYTISNLKINLPNEDYVGFFKWADCAEIYNLTIKNADITGRCEVGALMGAGWDTDMQNCNITGTVKITGQESVGGFIGEGSSINVDNCNVTGTGQITAQSSAGGIVGGLDGGNFIDSSTTINVKATNRAAGGFIGDFGDSSVYINDCFTTGNVSGGDDVGGFIGSGWKDGAFEMNDCTVYGAITGNDAVGGFVGFMSADETTSIYLTNCYMMGTYSGKSNVNWLFGWKSPGIRVYIELD